ncbi:MULTISPECIES: 3-hydroxyacyl-CoA dehydrogenase NAD-binding domain-containing protein [Rhodococcus]|uniref:3-hydroxyacyl-CoA dehydrogenase NAD-binding domain-containing protein n=1 Tax=Rhodococcus TaxID=1827 RepID=UPI000836CB76|nr:3-hydroxyacyl-CoA dehydrogenase NAD-binding domain-containing protein [Rhodococcus phenolicus]
MSTTFSTPTISTSNVDGVVTLTFDDPDKSVNTLSGRTVDDLGAVVDHLAGLGDKLRAVLLVSAKSTFMAGADLNEIVSMTDDVDAAQALATTAKTHLRRLESIGVPVVAAIGGTALGGGFELALAAHHRVLVDDPKVRVGLPESTLGLLPGGGGLVRTVRLLGLDTALDRVLLPGTSLKPAAALELGLVDRVVPAGELLETARTLALETTTADQPWDRREPIPGGTPADAHVEATLPLRAGALRAANKGAPMDAAAAILCAAVEGSQVDIDTAFEIETQWFVQLATSPQTRNIIQGTFFDMQTVRSGASRPEGFEPWQATRVAVLGAGMMGAGIALNAATSGMIVHLKDVDQAAAERGKAYAVKVLDKDVARGRRSQEQANAIAALIQPTTDVTDLAGADLLIEAVFEDPALKAAVLAEVVDVLAPDALLASNTSTLPITGLAENVARPEDFIGLHFFSPVERMDLLEIVVGEKTSDATVARAFDVARQLGKTPIVVNDGRGFYTSRVILTRLLEAAAMLAEGVHPMTIERASQRAGYPMGTLALLDEVTLALPHKIHSQFAEAARTAGTPFTPHPGAELLHRMIEIEQRPGRAAGAGFYEYVDGRRTVLWPGLTDKFGPFRIVDDIQELTDRLLFAEALDTARCLESGLLRSTADANIGSLLGIGYPRWTGGTAQFVEGYPGGVTNFVARARELAARHGERFTPPASLMAPVKETVDA